MKCQTKYCRNEADGRFCSTCRGRKWRENNPFRYHWQALKDNAKRRGKDFDLSLEEFKELWLKHPEKWEEKKAPGECKWQVDRDDPTKGYTADNVQIMEKSKNVIKYQRHGRFRMEVYWAERDGQLALGEQAPFNHKYAVMSDTSENQNSEYTGTIHAPNTRYLHVFVDERPAGEGRRFLVTTITGIGKLALMDIWTGEQWTVSWKEIIELATHKDNEDDN